jgi:predicted deacylase
MVANESWSKRSWTEIRVGTAAAKPGEVRRGGIPFGKDIYGNELSIPVTVMCGMEPGPVLWLDGATHGDEPEGSLSILMTLKELSPEDLRGAVVAVPALNVNAFAVGARGNPLDPRAYDLNRIYPGRHGGLVTERLARAHFEAMMACTDLQISVHSGGNHSYLCPIIFAPETPECLELAAAMGPDWPLVWKQHVKAGDVQGSLAAEGKAAMNVELGGQCRTLTNEFRDVCQTISRGFLNVMRHYGMLPGDAQYADSWKRGTQMTLSADHPGLWVAEPDLEFGEEMLAGTVLGKILDLYGDVLETVRAPEDGLVFGLRARPSVCIGEWVCFYGIVDEITSDLLLPR